MMIHNDKTAESCAKAWFGRPAARVCCGVLARHVRAAGAIQTSAAAAGGRQARPRGPRHPAARVSAAACQHLEALATQARAARQPQPGRRERDHDASPGRAPPSFVSDFLRTHQHPGVLVCYARVLVREQGRGGHALANATPRALLKRTSRALELWSPGGRVCSAAGSRQPNAGTRPARTTTGNRRTPEGGAVAAGNEGVCAWPWDWAVRVGSGCPLALGAGSRH